MNGFYMIEIGGSQSNNPLNGIFLVLGNEKASMAYIIDPSEDSSAEPVFALHPEDKVEYVCSMMEPDSIEMLQIGDYLKAKGKIDLFISSIVRVAVRKFAQESMEIEFFEETTIMDVIELKEEKLNHLLLSEASRLRAANK